MGIHSPPVKSRGDRIAAESPVNSTGLACAAPGFLCHSPLWSTALSTSCSTFPCSQLCFDRVCRSNAQSLCPCASKSGEEAEAGFCSWLSCTVFKIGQQNSQGHSQGVMSINPGWTCPWMLWLGWAVVLPSAGNSFTPVSWTQQIWGGSCSDGNGRYRWMSFLRP